MHLSWTEVEEMVKELAKQINAAEPLDKYRGIIAVSRGGLVPAGLLSYALNINRIRVAGVESYQQKEQNHLKIINIPKIEKGSGHYLLIDDLVDTGKTVRELRKLLPKLTVVTLISKPKGREEADIYARECAQDTWVHFPWE